LCTPSLPIAGNSTCLRERLDGRCPRPFFEPHTSKKKKEKKKNNNLADKPKMELPLLL
jgi:hypothetical protein